MAVSSISTAVSMSLPRHSSACSRSPSRMSCTTQEAPRSSDCQTHSFIVMRSTIPSSSVSDPIGICTGAGTAPVRSAIMRTQLKKSAPILSILLTNTTRGTL